MTLTRNVLKRWGTRADAHGYEYMPMPPERLAARATGRRRFAFSSVSWSTRQ